VNQTVGGKITRPVVSATSSRTASWPTRQVASPIIHRWGQQLWPAPGSALPRRSTAFVAYSPCDGWQPGSLQIQQCGSVKNRGVL